MALNNLYCTNVGFALTLVTMPVVKHRTEHPLLLIVIPICPSVARYLGRAASAANHLDFRKFLPFSYHNSSMALLKR